jgi:hypothetical protein
MQILLKRYYTKNGDGATLGILTAPELDKLNSEPICYTIERPLFYKGNSNKRDDKKTATINESCCIPIGKYKVVKHSSVKFPLSFLIKEVQGRNAILIHQANWMEELLGCIATVDQIVNSNKKPSGYWGFNSMEMLRKLENFIADKTSNINEFTLTIIDNQGELVKKQLLNKNKNLVL